MTTLQLRLSVEGATHTYTDDDLGEGSVAAALAYRDGEVEQEDVAVRVDAATFGPWASPLEVPGGRYRVELRDTALDEVVLNGTVHRTGVQPDEPAETDGLRSWSVRLLDTALADLLEALDGVPLRSLAADVEALGDDEDGVPPYVDVRTYVRRGADTDVTTLRWWSARRLLEAALTAAGATSVTVPPLFPLTFCYDDGGTQVIEAGDRAYVAYVGPLAEGQTAADPASTIPDVSGGDWWGTLSELLSLTLRAGYDAWPSGDTLATVTVDRWTEPVAEQLTALDAAGPDRLLLYGYDAECDPSEVPDFAVRFANDPGEFALSGEAVPPVGSRYASGRVVYSAGGIPEQDGATPLRQPRVAEVATSVQDGYAIQFGAPYLDADVDEPYLVWIQGAGLTHALMSYDADAAPAECPARYNPTWATVLYAGHALRASDVWRLQVEVDVDALAEAGAPAPAVLATQYVVEGAGWRTEAVTTDADSGEAELSLVRPALGYASQAAIALVGPPRLSAYLYYWTREDQAGEVIDDGWEAVANAKPGVGLSPPDAIEVEHSLDSAGGPWSAGGRVDLGAQQSRPAPVYFRARSVYDSEGYVSDWVAATAD